MLALCLTCLMAAGAQLRGDTVLVPIADFRAATAMLVRDSLLQQQVTLMDSALSLDSVAMYSMGLALKACEESGKVTREGLDMADGARLDAVAVASDIESDNRHWRWAVYATGSLNVILGISAAVLLIAR